MCQIGLFVKKTVTQGLKLFGKLDQGGMKEPNKPDFTSSHTIKPIVKLDQYFQFISMINY